MIILDSIWQYIIPNIEIMTLIIVMVIIAFKYSAKRKLLVIKILLSILLIFFTIDTINSYYLFNEIERIEIYYCNFHKIDTNIHHYGIKIKKGYSGNFVQQFVQKSVNIQPYLGLNNERLYFGANYSFWGKYIYKYKHLNEEKKYTLVNLFKNIEKNKNKILIDPSGSIAIFETTQNTEHNALSQEHFITFSLNFSNSNVNQERINEWKEEAEDVFEGIIPVSSGYYYFKIENNTININDYNEKQRIHISDNFIPNGEDINQFAALFENPYIRALFLIAYNDIDFDE